MRIAIVHDWMTGMRGGEKVLLGLLELFPGADLFTLVYRADQMDDVFKNRKITTSALQHLPFGKTKYQYYLPLFWELTGGFDLSGYDLIISSSSACARIAIASSTVAPSIFSSAASADFRSWRSR